MKTTKITLEGRPHRQVWMNCLPTSLFILVNNLHSIRNLRVRWTIEFETEEYEESWRKKLIDNSAMDIIKAVVEEPEGPTFTGEK